MADPLKFDLVSPERLLLSEEVESVVVPGGEGYFTVFAQHAPLMSTLKPGQIEVKALSGDVRKFFVRGGFADVTPGGLTILADQAIPLEDLDAGSSGAGDQERRGRPRRCGRGSHAAPHRRDQANELRDVQRWIIPA